MAGWLFEGRRVAAVHLALCLPSQFWLCNSSVSSYVRLLLLLGPSTGALSDDAAGRTSALAAGQTTTEDSPEPNKALRTCPTLPGKGSSEGLGFLLQTIAPASSRCGKRFLGPSRTLCSANFETVFVTAVTANMSDGGM